MQRTIHSRTRPWLWSHALPLILLAFPAIPQSEENKPATSTPPIQPEMVLLEGGEFLMGSDEGGDSSPLHGVVVSPFYLDKYEVTNSQYSEFCEETGRRLPEFWGMDVYRSGPDYPRHPVIGISWHDADAYAKWRGARLPTEAEWEFAARGGLVGMNFSHGDVFDSTLYANTGRTGVASPVAAGSFPPNGFGLHDMTGNVVEWVYDRYDAVYYVQSPSENPTGPGTGTFRVIRGGGWHTGPYCSRVYFRNALKSNWVDFNVGFRCAKYVGESAALLLEKSIQKAGIDTTLTQYQAIWRSPPGEYYFDESEFNDVGYRLLGKELITEAIAVFKLNVEVFPKSYNAYDSLGEAYMTAGENELAIINYTKSLELHPGSTTGKKALKKLGVE